jgi:8-oxo-dGTP diphosphatase
MNCPGIELRVVCAVIADEAGRYLVAKRPMGKALGGKWEFPGGKIDAGEEPSDALLREIREEMGVTIRILDPLAEVLHHYETVSIRLIPFLALIQEGDLVPLEHEEIRWVALDEIQSLDLAEADVSIVKALLATC